MNYAFNVRAEGEIDLLRIVNENPEAKALLVYSEKAEFPLLMISLGLLSRANRADGLKIHNTNGFACVEWGYSTAIPEQTTDGIIFRCGYHGSLNQRIDGWRVHPVNKAWIPEIVKDLHALSTFERKIHVKVRQLL